MDLEFVPIVEVVMTQYNMKQGLMGSGQSGVIAIKKEVCQLVTMDTLDPEKVKEIRREDCSFAMA